MPDAHHLGRAGSDDLAHDATAMPEGREATLTFQKTWGARLKPYLAPADYEELSRLCDPQHPEFALQRPDFHFLQTFTLVVGEL